jgi:hypothetical protein
MLRRIFFVHALAGLCGLLSKMRGSFAGSYGEAKKEFAGFEAHIDASVGSMSDPEQETRRYHRKMSEAEQALAKAEPRLGKLLMHYRSGAHPHARLRKHLLEKRPTGNERHRIDLRLPSETADAGLLAPIETTVSNIQLHLYIDNALPPPLRIKLMVDVALSQLWPGGVLAKVPPNIPRSSTLAEAQSLLAALAPSLSEEPSLYQCPIFLLLAREREAQVRQIAALRQPAPATLDWQKTEAPLGWFVAKALVKTLDKKAIDDELAAALKHVAAASTPTHAERAALLLLLFLRDDEWPAQLEMIRRTAQAVCPNSKLLLRYIDALKKYDG